jgi:two-component system response regulator YesN
MFKVFFVEDEIVVREGFRNNILWEQHGFTYVGDTSDGEMALPMIRELRPDLLITDIRMPFMDGLALSELVRKELPKTKIVIISGYDDFSYAQQAIRMGVERYLLKPVTKDKLVQILTELKKKMEAEKRQEEYLLQFQREAGAYEMFSRRRFFEQIASGNLTVSEIYETARTMDMDLSAQAYNIVFFTLGGAGQKGSMPSGYSDVLTTAEDKITHFFAGQTELLLFRWNLTTYAVLVKGSQNDISQRSQMCVNGLRDICETAAGEIHWHVACGTPVTRISALPTCFIEANRLITYRYIYPEEHILSEDRIRAFRQRETARAYESEALVEPELIRSFLSDGTEEEINGFVEQIRRYVGENTMKSLLFAQYLAMTICFVMAEYIESTGAPRFAKIRPTGRDHDLCAGTFKAGDRPS